MPRRKSYRRVRDPLSCLPSSESVQEGLDRILTEAAKLQKLLALTREVEATEASDLNDCTSNPLVVQEGQQ